MEFLDLHGASGHAYRFRAWPHDGHHTPAAGNYIALRARTRKLVAIGVLDNLAEVPQRLGDLGAGVKLFTRLNVSRAQREAEHADLVAAHAMELDSVAAGHRLGDEAPSGPDRLKPRDGRRQAK